MSTALAPPGGPCPAGGTVDAGLVGQDLGCFLHGLSLAGLSTVHTRAFLGRGLRVKQDSGPQGSGPEAARGDLGPGAC